MLNDDLYKVVEKDKGPLRFELVSPSGIVIATFRTKEQADASAKVSNLLRNTFHGELR